MLALRRARRVRDRRLDEQHERHVGVRGPRPTASSDAAISAHRPAEVDGSRARRRGVGPRDRPVERPVDLEHPRPVAEALELAPVPAGEAVAGHGEHLARRDVEQVGRARAAGPRGIHAMARDDLHARATVPRPRARRAIAPLPPRATGQPTACASSPSTSPNDALSGAWSGSIECAAIPANSARAVGLAEREPGQVLGRQQRRQAEARHEDRVARRPDDGRQEHRHEPLPLAATSAPKTRRQSSASRPSAASSAGPSSSRGSTTLRSGRVARGRPAPPGGPTRARGGRGRASGRTARPGSAGGPTRTGRGRTPAA